MNTAERTTLHNVIGLIEMAQHAYCQGSFEEMEDYLRRAFRLLTKIL